MNDVNLVAIDLAKNFFQIHAVCSRGQVILRKQLKRHEVLHFFSQLPKCRIAMEACGSSQYWARKFGAMGHQVNLIAAQFVKPFVKSQKNDVHDAEAIAEAAMRPTMRFVPLKSIEKQDIQSLHKSRDLVVETRVALVNHLRGLLMEYGVVLPEGYASFKKQIIEVLEDANLELTPMIRTIVHSILAHIKNLDSTEKSYRLQLKQISEENADCQRLMTVPGVGPLIATHFFSAVADPNSFKNGRQCSAWLGLVPKQSSSGGKATLGGITKRGDRDLRRILFEGASSIVVCAKRFKKTDPISQWALKLWETKGYKKAVIAVENKLCRIMWWILAHKENYQCQAKV